MASKVNYPFMQIIIDYLSHITRLAYKVKFKERRWQRLKHVTNIRKKQNLIAIKISEAELNLKEHLPFM